MTFLGCYECFSRYAQRQNNGTYLKIAYPQISVFIIC